MANNLLWVVQEFCRRTGLRKPSSVAGSQDVGVAQYMALINEIVEEMTDDYFWTELTREATFTTIAGEDQGDIADLAPNGFIAVIKDTIYDRTQKVPLYGPLSPQVWQQGKAFIPAGPLYRYRFRQGRLLFMPEAVAGHECAFEYYSNLAIYNSVDDEYKTEFTKDNDTFLLPVKILLQGLRWKWKCEKGLPYAEEHGKFMRSCTNAAARSGVKQTLYLDGTAEDAIVPNILVQPGNWDV